MGTVPALRNGITYCVQRVGPLDPDFDLILVSSVVDTTGARTRTNRLLGQRPSSLGHRATRVLGRSRAL